MQEQQPYKITPDQAWEKMKPILDEAMPVKPRMRRYPFLWWSTSAVTITAVMSLLLFNKAPKQSSTAGSPATEIKSPSAADKTSGVIDPVLSSTGTSHTATSKVASPSHQMEKTGQKEEPKHNASGTEKGVKKTATPSGKTRVKQTTVPLAFYNPSRLDEKSLPQEIKSSGTNTAAPEVAMPQTNTKKETTETMSERGLRNGQVLESLPALDMIAIEAASGMDNQIIPGKSSKFKRNPKLVEPSLAVSGLAGVNGGLGAYGGAGVGFNVGSRFCVTTSIGYLSYSPNSYLLGNLKSLDSNAEYNSIVNYDPYIPGNEVYVDAQNVNNEAGYNAINPLVDRLTQWQVAAGLKWKISPRFFTEGGVQFGFGTQAYSQYPIISFDHLGSTPTTVKIDRSLNDYDVIRTSTTSLYLGLGYRIGSHFDVFTSWTHGMQQYLLNDTTSPTTDMQSEERTDYIRGLSLGLRYTL